MLKYFFVLCLIFFFISCQGQNAVYQKASHQAQDSLPSEQLPRKPDFKAAGLTEVDVRTFFDSLQRVVRNNDKQALAKMINYPCHVLVNNQSFQMKSAEEFLAKYNEIWGEKIREIVKGQKFEDLFANWQGVRIGKGQVWFAGIWEKHPGDGEGYEVKIITINNF